MLTRALLTCVLLLGASCDKAAVVSDMERLADQTCACPDRECLDKVERAHKQDRVVDPRGLAPDDVESLHAANKRRGDCRERILTGHAAP